MKFDPAIHHRLSIGLQGYDDSRAGAYFITICILDRRCLFGEIVKDQMRLNDAGNNDSNGMNEIPAHYPGIGIGEFVVMPNHMNGIIDIVGRPPWPP